MNIVSIYAPRRDHPKWQDYRSFLDVQRKSIERMGHRQIVITDEAGAKEMPGFDCFVAYEMPADLMSLLIYGQMNYLASAACDDDTLLIGADGLLCADPAPIFDGSFDIGVTTHPFHDCHVNTGLIAVPLRSKWVAVDRWEVALLACRDRWGDDQRAIAMALDAPLEHGVHDREWGRLKCMPVPGYNDAPDSIHDGIMPVIAHFRGPRKKWMADWGRRHLGIT